MLRSTSSRHLFVYIVATVLLLAALLFIMGHAHAESLGNTITVEGDTDGITFTVNYTPASPIRIVWGVSGQPLQEKFITFTGSSQTVVPPAGTVSILVNISGVAVQTPFTQLTSDGWYAVPMADHRVTIIGDTHAITFTTNFTPTAAFRLVWGISGQPLLEQFITMTARSLTISTPPHAVSLLFNNSGVKVETTFRQLTTDGWYEIPVATIPPIVYHYHLFLPAISRR